MALPPDAPRVSPDAKSKRKLRRDNYTLFQFYRGKPGQSIWTDKLPLAGPPPSILMPGTVQGAWPFVPAKKDNNVDVDLISSVFGLEEKLRKPFEMIKRMKSHFARNYPEMKYNRCLGWGGNGLAAAYDVMNTQGMKVRSVVVKTIFNDNPELQRWEYGQVISPFAISEHNFLFLAASKNLPDHGLGLIDNDESVDEDISSFMDDTSSFMNTSWDDSPLPGSSSEESYPDDEETKPDKPGLKRKASASNLGAKRVKSNAAPLNVFITEMLENGDLASFIKKVRQWGDSIPNPVLWRFLLCFTRMCIGLAYPPADFEELKLMPGPITERVPVRNRDHPRRIVHFDIDPTNIFVGDMWELSDEHSMAPLLKLGDFGLAHDVAAGQKDIYYEKMRPYAKKGYFAPEQFCQDWDYLERDSGHIKDQPVAGNYGVHTNIWGVGYVMENLITQCYPASPPIPTESTLRPPDGKTTYFTYAQHLEQPFYDHVDRDMIALIMRMQAHFPQDRPPLHEIESFVLHSIETKGNDGKTDQELNDWVRKILYETPPRSRELYKPGPVIRVREQVGVGRFNIVPDYNFTVPDFRYANQGDANVDRPANVQPSRRLRPRNRRR
ncbi:kinase-like domain-containing protein [Astrocystis sublimbata]|nr:kinase-like domain-containing protein [Astrocystis sublimbata]